MKSIIITFTLLTSLQAFSGEELIENMNNIKTSNNKGFYLRQVDYRTRGSVAVSIPGLARLRFRPSYEYRYRVDKKVVPVKKEKYK